MTKRIVKSNTLVKVFRKVYTLECQVDLTSGNMSGDSSNCLNPNKLDEVFRLDQCCFKLLCKHLITFQDRNFREKTFVFKTQKNFNYVYIFFCWL